MLAAARTPLSRQRDLRPPLTAPPRCRRAVAAGPGRLQTDLTPPRRRDAPVTVAFGRVVMPSAGGAGRGWVVGVRLNSKLWPPPSPTLTDLCACCCEDGVAPQRAHGKMSNFGLGKVGAGGGIRHRGGRALRGEFHVALLDERARGGELALYPAQGLCICSHRQPAGQATRKVRLHPRRHRPVSLPRRAATAT